VEADRRRPRKPPRERAETGERPLRLVLAVTADGGGDLRLRVLRSEPGRRRVLAFCGYRPAQPL
jgi:hypothetical protein